MEARNPPRVFVGVEGTLAGLEALRRAVLEARRTEAELYAVRCWAWPAAAGPGGAMTAGAASLAGPARETVRRAFADAMGGVPGDIRVLLVLPEAAPGPALVGLADREGDLLVVGRARRHRLRRLLSGSTSRYCVAHARCPVLVVPPHALAGRLGDRRRWRAADWREVPRAWPGPAPGPRGGGSDVNRSGKERR